MTPLFTIFSAFLAFLRAAGYTRGVVRSLAMDTGNPILDPILGFFQAIWDGLVAIWQGLVDAIVSWLQAVWNYTYAGIPVGPLMFILLVGASFLLIYAAFRVKDIFFEG